MACAIVPPYILEHLAGRVPEPYRTFVLRSLRQSDQMRGSRAKGGKKPAKVPGAKRYRGVYDTENTALLPGRVLARKKGAKPTKDPAVDEAYDGAAATHAFHAEVFGHRGIDGKGRRVNSTVHYEVKYDNAFWDGTQLVYGDGDGRWFRRFTKCPEIVGHELAHAVIEHTAGLAYADQPGALNEHLSDVFGVLAKQRALGQTARQADWVIGAGLFMPKVRGAGLRSMKAPGTAYDDPNLGADPQPDHLKHYVKTEADNGGVHYNSGIPNKAFYLVAAELGGRAWEHAGRIWHVAQRDHFQEKTSFKRAANATWRVAKDLYGRGSKEASAVKGGWHDVGIKVR